MSYWRECDSCNALTQQPGDCKLCEAVKVPPYPNQEKDVDAIERSMNNLKAMLPGQTNQVTTKPSLITVKGSNKMSIKSELTEAGSMVMVNQASKIAVEGIKQLINASSLAKAKKKLLLDMLNTDAGRALCLTLVGVALPYVPQLQGNKRLMELAAAMRLSGMATMGNEAIDTIAIPMFQKVSGSKEMDPMMLMQMIQDPGTFLANVEHEEVSGLMKTFQAMAKKFNVLAPAPASTPAEVNTNGKKVNA